MTTGFDNKVIGELNRMAQVRWKETIEGTEAQLLPLSPADFKILRVYFQIAYEAGTADTLIQLKEIYHSDVDLFQGIFEDEEEIN